MHRPPSPDRLAPRPRRLLAPVVRWPGADGAQRPLLADPSWTGTRPKPGPAGPTRRARRTARAGPGGRITRQAGRVPYTR